ncbi:MAG: hypothetical protein ABIR32_19695 [Ilumatobacteraceae bacterium]
MTKHPDVDHAGHLARIRAAMPTSRRAKLWTVDCLDLCEHSNVVVVRDGSGHRRWFGEMLHDDDITALTRWLGGGAVDDVPVSLARREFVPTVASSAVTARMAEWSPSQLVDVIERTLRERSGSWSVGVHGAGAEVLIGDQQTSVVRSERTCTATTETGALRMTVDDDTHAFVIDRPDQRHRPAVVIFAVLATALQPSWRAITLRGADIDAIRPENRGDTIVDLGIGRSDAAFCVRTSDPELIALAERVRGRYWRDALDDIEPMLVARSPDRVVISSLARAEVSVPIPKPHVASHTGAHSHLRPEDLDLGLSLPPGIVLPNGFTPVASLFPNERWTPIR